MDDLPSSRRARFEALAADVYEPVQRYVRRRVDGAAVDDVVADTMLALWRRLDDIPSAAGLAWAYAVARRQVANHRRATKRHLRLVQRAGAQPTPTAPTDGPLDAELHAALADLPTADREILRLWAWEGLEAAAIGTALDLTANAAAIRLHRAKAKLRERLAPGRKDPAPSGHSHPASSKEERP